MSTPLPRLLIAAPSSGSGKTTVATGLLAAWRSAGLATAGFKVGPDYIDPGYHALATGRPGRNLDPVLCQPERLAPLLLHGAATPVPADVAVIEGVMGLFDGRLGTDGDGSSAQVARLLDLPVILVLDIAGLSRTAAALLHGLHTFDPALRLAGVILNRGGSGRQVAEVTRAVEAVGLPVLGALPRDVQLEVPSRHLGLVPAAERAEAAATVRSLGERVAEHVKLTDLLAIARGAPPLDAEPWSPHAEVSPPSPRRPVVAMAGGAAFTFRYAETEELLAAAGCRPVPFDPLTDTRLPDGTSGLYLGGGFPQVHATDLAANQPLRAEIASAVAAGMPTVAECAGLLYLCREVDGIGMVGAVDADATMTPRLTLGYRTAVSDADHLLAEADTRVTAHEFHRTAVRLGAGRATPAWLVDGHPEGIATPTLHASYLHTHWAGHPHLAARFARAIHDFDAKSPPRTAPTTQPSRSGPDLSFHGDAEVADGLIDLAVNVRLPVPPVWVRQVVEASLERLGAYPCDAAAVEAIAHAHAVPRECALPTAGGAEAFTLLARALRPSRAVIVHPQFTEPEAALRAAGHPVDRVLLSPDRGFRLDLALVPPAADLVVIGNPTNPTSVLHPAAALRSLLRPGRVVCVDEAFMDAVAGEPESLLAAAVDLSGLLVVRSLTKTWGLAGLRAGYVVGDPDLIGRLRAAQPRWPVSTPALAVLEACLSDTARTLAAEAAEEIAEHRDVLVAALEALGLPVAGVPRGPFVLVNVGAWEVGRPAGWVRHALRERGFALRRGDTFPGLGPDWVRIAVRDEATTTALAKGLAELRDEG